MKSISGPKGLGGLDKSVTASLKGLSGTSKGSIGGLGKSLEKITNVSSKSLKGLSVDMVGFTETALGVSRAFGLVGLAIGAVAVGITAAVAGIGKAAQPAAKFETDLKRLNLALGQSTTSFMQWSRTQGLARSTAAEMGATYGMLLSSFISNNAELTKSTEDLVQATRVVASATGRSIQESQERIRSGLLGNTEAIEDLGIFTNVSMIESTNAFKKFANGKHWDQLDFRLQQQIRLQAILEQANARYGNSLQNSVMTKQGQLSEQLKDIKLNLSNAFLPIWEKILPWLAKLGEMLVNITDKIARFSYWLAGKDYEKATNGTNVQTKAVDELGNSYQEAGQKAADSLAAFDEINQIGDTGTGGNSSNTGSSSSGGSGGTTSPLTGSGFPKLPTPEEIGMGPLVVMFEKVSEKIEALKTNWATMLENMQRNMNTYQLNINAGWEKMLEPIKSLNQELDTSKSKWQEALGFQQLQLTTYQPGITLGWNSIRDSIVSMTNSLDNSKGKWHDTLDYDQTQLNAYQPYLSFGWGLIKISIDDLIPSLENLKKKWHESLDFMQSKLNSYQPFISFGISLVGLSLAYLQGDFKDTENENETMWTKMLSTVKQNVSGMKIQINSLIASYSALKVAQGGTATQPITIPSDYEFTPQPTTETPTPSTKEETKSSTSAVFEKINQMLQSLKISPGLDTGLNTGGGIKLPGVGADMGLVPKLIEQLKGLFQGAGSSVPALASGGITNSPMLALIGDNPGGKEVVAPLDNLMDMMQSAVATAVMTASQFGSSSDSKQVNINLQIDGVSIARAIHPYMTNESARIGASMITTT